MQKKEFSIPESQPDFAVLFSYGEILDAVDAGSSTITPQQYRIAAKNAKSFIVTHWGHPQLRKECDRAWALQDILENVEFERRFRENEQRLAHAQFINRYQEAGPLQRLAY